MCRRWLRPAGEIRAGMIVSGPYGPPGELRRVLSLLARIGRPADGVECSTVRASLKSMSVARSMGEQAAYGRWGTVIATDELTSRPAPATEVCNCES